MTTAESTAPVRSGSSSPWIHGPMVDTLAAWSWGPFAAGGVIAQTQGALPVYALGVLVVSLAHQPITLALVYGDRDRFAANRSLFIWAPLALAAAIIVGLAVDPMVVAVIGGLWNTHHTLMQRYGMVRIYRRKGISAGHARADLTLLGSWLAVVLAWAAVDSRTPDRIQSMGLGSANQRALEVLVDLRPFAALLLAAAGVAALGATLRWLAAERASGCSATPATYCYVASSACLFGVAVVHPVAGLLGWIGAHAVEYFVIVTTDLERRHGATATAPTYRSLSGPGGPSPLARALSGRLGTAGFVALFSLVVVGGLVLLQFRASVWIYGLAFFGVGGLHILYDGVIWKLRQPTVAAALTIDP